MKNAIVPALLSVIILLMAAIWNSHQDEQDDIGNKLDSLIEVVTLIAEKSHKHESDSNVKFLKITTEVNVLKKDVGEIKTEVDKHIKHYPYNRD